MHGRTSSPLPALISAKIPKVVDGVERVCVQVPCILMTGQCTVVHHLRIFEAAVISVEVPQVVDGVKRGCVLRPFFTGQCTIIHHLSIFEAALIVVEGPQV